MVFTAPDGTEFTQADAGDDDAADSDADPDTGSTGTISLGIGEDIDNVDAGIVPLLGSIGDKVFDDLDGDGIQGPDEPGVPGVTVTLVDADGNETTTTTNDQGEYLFDELPAGDYTVVFEAPEGTLFTVANAGDDDDADSDAGPNGSTGTISVGAGEAIDNVDAGLVPVPENPAIGLAKDLVGNPTKVPGDNNEWALSYTFEIVNLGDVALSNVTLSDNVAAGLEGLNGTAISGPLPNDAGTCSVSAAVGSLTLGVGESCTAVWDFVIERTGNQAAPLAFDNSATVAGTSPRGEEATDTSDDGTNADANGDGNGDEEGENDPTPALIPGVLELAVSDPFTCGDAGFTGEVLRGVGPYTLTYTLRPASGGDLIELGSFNLDNPGPFTTPAGFIDDILGTNDDYFVSIVLTDSYGQSVDAQDLFIAVVREPCTASLGNKVFEDTNRNGLDDDGDNGIDGVTVRLLDAADESVLDETETADGGFYLFEGLDPDLDYIVEVVQPDGREFTSQDTGDDDGIDSDVDTNTGRTGAIDLDLGETDLTWDAGILPIPSPAIGLAKDLTAGPTANGDGTFNLSYTFVIENLGDVALSGVTLTDNVGVGLAGTTGSVVAGPVPDATGTCSAAVSTGTQGLGVGESCTAVWNFVIEKSGSVFDSLSFDNSASVRGESPQGVEVTDISDDGAETDANDNGNGDEDGENDPTPATIPGIEPSSISNKVFQDLDGDGVQDLSEPGVDGVTVNLLDTDGNVLATAVTENGGMYLFDGLEPGDYVVEFIAPDGTVLTSQDAQADDATDSDADPATGRTATISLGAGEDIDTVDAGLIDLGSIGNFVWDDVDRNGDQDDDEPGIAGAVVTLHEANADGTRGDPIGDPQTTDDTGFYLFDDLPAGEYIVNVVPPGDFDGPANDFEITLQNVAGEEIDSDADRDTGDTDVISIGIGEDDLTNDIGVREIFELTLEDPYDCGVGFFGTIGPGAAPFTLQYLLYDPITDTEVDLGSFVVPEAGDYVTPDGFVDSVLEFNVNGEVTIILTDSIGQSVRKDNLFIAEGRNPCIYEPALGLAKDLVGGPTFNAAGNVEMTFSYVIENVGNMQIIDIVLTDDFAAVFGPEGTVVSGPTPADSGCSAAVAAGTQILEVGESCTAVWTIEMSDLIPGKTYDNIAEVNGGLNDDFSEFATPEELAMIRDVSSDGADVDPNGDGDPGESSPTPVTIPASSLGDKVWEDTDRDGVQDASESAVAGAVISLYAADDAGAKGAVLRTQTTGSNGMYLFENLAAGRYIVVVKPPAGMRLTSQDAGSDDSADSDVDPDTGESDVIALAVSETILTVDAGLVRLPTTTTPSTGGPLPLPSISNAPAATTPPPPVITPPDEVEGLALTGSNSNVLATVAIAMMALGATLMTGARRERRKD